MSRQQKRIVIVVVIVIIALVAVIGLSHRQNLANSPSASQSKVSFTKVNSSAVSQPAPVNSDQAHTVIESALGTVGTSGTPFTIAQQVQPIAGWVVFSLTYPDFPDAHEQVIAKQDATGALTYVAGPITPFSLEALQAANVPTAVIDAVDHEDAGI